MILGHQETEAEVFWKATDEGIKVMYIESETVTPMEDDRNLTMFRAFIELTGPVMSLTVHSRCPEVERLLALLPA